jgi:threonine dehydrogenase-like Zn-dependent dehydrogenase
VLLVLISGKEIADYHDFPPPQRSYRDLLVATKSYPGDYAPDLIPLSDGAGEVVAIGDNVSRFAIGDRVANSTLFSILVGPTPCS